MIPSLNGVTSGGWADYATAMAAAGAAAIGLNIYFLPGDAQIISGRDVEERHIDVLAQVKDVVMVSLAVAVAARTSARAARWRCGSTRLARMRWCSSTGPCSPTPTLRR